MVQDQSMEYGSDYKWLPVTSVLSGRGVEILPDLYCLTVQIVNVCFVGEPEADTFVLVDAGMPASSDAIVDAVERRFGSSARPRAIVLTHGHFDHVGAVIELVRHWDVPVYAHELELPYLTGQQSYPEADAAVEGGLVAKISPLFPREPINLGNRVEALPAEGAIPGMEGWRWIHTPGHSPGHVSLFRERDRALIAGDAFVSVRQDSLYRVLMQDLELNGPPRYFTTDWQAAWASVRTLAALQPDTAVTGHGQPVSGESLRERLARLAEQFDRVAIPDYGKSVDRRLH